MRVEVRKGVKFLNDKRLSYAEKALLRSLVALRKGHIEEVFELLGPMVMPNLFLEAFKYHFLGLTCNNAGRLDEAIKYLKQAIGLFDDCEDKDYIFYPYNSIFLSYANLFELDQMKLVLKNLKLCNLSTKFKEAMYLKNTAIYHLHAGQMSLSISLADKLKSEFTDVVSDEFSSLILIKFMAFLKLKDMESCHQQLEAYKGATSGIYSKANYKFMKLMLNHLEHETQLYVYPNDFKDAPFLLNQLMVIKELSIGNLQAAAQSWEYLQKHYPHMYAEDYVYNGDVCLFSLALDKYRSNAKSVFSSTDLDSLKTVQEKLVYILTKTNAPLSKEELIKLIWHEDYSLANGNRLDSLVDRVKKKFGLTISVRMGSYSLGRKKVS